MNDEEIIALYWSRSEKAISETQLKYGSYCHRIAFRILQNSEDSEECVNDTYLKAWETIPPTRPEVLSVFLGTITRNLSLNKYKYYSAEKRGGGQVTYALDELQECISGKSDVEQFIEDELLVDILNHFLSKQNQKTRKIFMRRYWFLCSIKEIAEEFHMSESSVKMNLQRARRNLKKILEKEGIVI